jgi:hypothetical protein
MGRGDCRLGKGTASENRPAEVNVLGRPLLWLRGAALCTGELMSTSIREPVLDEPSRARAMVRRLRPVTRPCPVEAD